MRRIGGIVVAMGVLLSGPTEADTVMKLGDSTLEAIVLSLEKNMSVDGCVGPSQIDIPDIRFAIDSAVLSAAATTQMTLLASAIRSFPNDPFVIEGHADASGTDAHNLALSRDRAKAVRSALLARGIPAARVGIRAYGERRLLYPHDPYHANNRRVSLLRLNPSTVLREVVAEAAAGRPGLAAHIRKLVPGTGGASYLVDPQAKVFERGESFFLCATSSRSGLLEIHNKAPGEGDFSFVGAWAMKAETLVKAPSEGAFTVTGEPGDELLRLRHVSCAAHPARCVRSTMAHARLESIELVGGTLRPIAVQEAPGAAPDCGTAGVACLTLRLRRTR